MASTPSTPEAARSTPPAAIPHAEAIGRGELVLHSRAEDLAQLGFALRGGLALDDSLRFTLAPRAPLLVELRDGGPTRVGNAPVALPGLVLRRDDGSTTPALELLSDAGSVDAWRIVDASGAVWLRITQPMRSPDGSQALRLFTSDLRAGPALADWLGKPVDGTLLANAELTLPLRLQPQAVELLRAQAKNASKSCAVPNWPGTPGFITDVILTNMDTIDVMRCRTLGGSDFCDGPGGVDGEVVIVPSVTLRNSSAPNASEVPWYTKFSGNYPPYGNDQHPFLVWNMYRIDAEGRIDQIARSGLKHAFATANTNCVEACTNPNILGRGCEDLYNNYSNDSNLFLAPRSEVIPSHGVWGRCGSVFDDGLDSVGNGTEACDSVPDAPPVNDGYRERLRARESDIDAAANPGAVYLMDAWYVVRDDQDLFNTMGSRTLIPQWILGKWTMKNDLGPFVSGSVLDRWLELAPVGVTRGRHELETAEGRVVVATRITRLPDTRYQYDYALMNYDLTRPVLDAETAEPNLRVLRNHGVSEAVLALREGATADSAAMRDGDTQPGNDWAQTLAADSISWVAPGNTAYLEWGQLVTMRVISTRAPGPGSLTLTMAEPGSPAGYAMTVPVPDASRMFSDSFD